ncbi:MAG: helix-turn-helix domain-containing protein [Reyranellaceae bacterium]
MQGERLKQLWTAAGFESLAAFADRAGVPYQSAQKHVQRDSIPSKWATRYIAAARSTGADVAWLLSGTGTPPRTATLAEPRKPVDRSEGAMRTSGIGNVIERTPPITWAPESPLPIRETIETGEGWMLTGSVVEYLPRPEYISPQSQAFCIYVPDDTMAPRFERGDRLLANPALPVVPDKDVILLAEPDAAGRQRGLIRRLVAIDGKRLTVRAYNPAGVAELDRAAWPYVFRIDAGRFR